MSGDGSHPPVTPLAQRTGAAHSGRAGPPLNPTYINRFQGVDGVENCPRTRKVAYTGDMGANLCHDCNFPILFRMKGLLRIYLIFNNMRCGLCGMVNSRRQTTLRRDGRVV